MSPAAQTLEGRTRVLVERVLDLRPAARIGPGALVELSQERLRRDPAGFLSGGSTNLAVGRDDPDLLALAVLSGEALDERVRFPREANLQAPVGRVLPDAVEHDDPPCPMHGHEARQPVDQLLALPERARVEDVVAVEEIEHAVRMPVWRPSAPISPSWWRSCRGSSARASSASMQVAPGHS